VAWAEFLPKSWYPHQRSMAIEGMGGALCWKPASQCCILSIFCVQHSAAEREGLGTKPIATVSSQWWVKLARCTRIWIEDKLSHISPSTRFNVHYSCSGRLRTGTPIPRVFLP
jgi:hypothetical protein